jgi:hypothetical protein
MSNDTQPEQETIGDDPQNKMDDQTPGSEDSESIPKESDNADDVQWLEPNESITIPDDSNNQNLTIAAAILIVVLLISAIFAANSLDIFGDDDDDDPTDGPGASSGGITWGEPVWLPRDPGCVDTGNGQEYPEYAIGYEPSIAVDGQGNLYYTAHKDLRWCGPLGGPLNIENGIPGPGPFACVQGLDTTWDYYASWFFVSQDGGTTWGPPNDWGIGDYGSEFGGDEGDIGVDAMDRVYFCDTTLEDDWLHIWEDGGDSYVNGQRLQSMTADDRPWIDAQGDGIVHFLGNNGVSVPGIPLSSGTSGVGRYWYYRGVLDPTGTYVVFDQGRVLEGGWAHISAERDGDHVYIAQEAANGGGGAVKVWVSDDTGNTWRDPVEVGPLSGSHPEGYPWVGVGENGTAFVAWQQSPQGGREVGTLMIAKTTDYGLTWEHWDITAGYPVEEGGVYLYPNLEVGPGNVVAYTFYGNEGTHTAGDEWHLYAGVLKDPEPGEIFTFTQADPFPLHTTTQAEEDADDLHPLHDLFEVAVSPVDNSIHIAYQYNIGEHPFEDGEEQRYLMYIRGDIEEGFLED